MSTNVDINFLLDNICPVAQSVLDRTFEEPLNYPINLDKIANAFEVPIYKEKLDDNLAGCFIAEGGKSAIVVNEKDPEARQRFTIAHELGHFISYKLQEKEGSIFDERGTLASMGIDPEEIFANKFAAEILMPRAAFMDKMKSIEQQQNKSEIIESIMKYFNVSKRAVEIRIKTLAGSK